MFLFPFKLSGIWSWWQVSFRFSEPNIIPFVFKIESKTVNLKRSGNIVFSMQTYSCLRDASISLQSWNPTEDTLFRKPSDCHSSIVLRGLKEVLNWSSSPPRESPASLSETADAIFPSPCSGYMIRFCFFFPFFFLDGSVRWDWNIHCRTLPGWKFFRRLW